MRYGSQFHMINATTVNYLVRKYFLLLYSCIDTHSTKNKSFNSFTFSKNKTKFRERSVQAWRNHIFSSCKFCISVIRKLTSLNLYTVYVSLNPLQNYVSFSKVYQICFCFTIKNISRYGITQNGTSCLTDCTKMQNSVRQQG